MRGSSKPRGADAMRAASLGPQTPAGRATRRPPLSAARAATARAVLRPYIDRAPTLGDAIARLHADLRHLMAAEGLTTHEIAKRSWDMREDDIEQTDAGCRSRGTPVPITGISRRRNDP